MENIALLKQLTDKTAGILYFSESEYPLTIEQWGVLPPADVHGKIAALHHVSPDVLRSVEEEAFFSHITAAADPNDAPIVANAQKFKALRQFLRENLTNIQITRVEAGASIPVYITGHQADGTCIALTTTAIES
ncbi:MULTISPECIES: nuclease A inhibitor family protein [unclassified Chitinophaga]|uniref:nuclease A inhibitor family protein n=1 Tax=unclassified Chitinophaga TaxID=2619133 RepID=UPI00300F8C88